MASERFASSGQSGLPGHCYVAQVWDENGSSVAEITPNNDPAIATRLAELFADSLNVLHTTGKTPRELAGEVERLERTIGFSDEWYSTRLQRLRDMVEQDASHLIDKFCNIVANGTGSSMEPPTYAQQMNSLKHKNARLAEQRDQLADFVADVAKNYDCDSDAHKYGTRCRKCEAAETLARVNQPAATDQGASV